jgi:hypothetical protein
MDAANIDLKGFTERFYGAPPHRDDAAAIEPLDHDAF